MKYWIALITLLWVCSVGFAQTAPSPYEIALQRIQEAEASGATELELSQSGLTELPPEIGNLSNLQTLRLFNNQLSSLPPEIGNLTNLQELNVYHNQLSSLPPEVGNLTNLQELVAPFNQLNSLPPEIGNLTNLQKLYLFGNQLGNLPAEIGNLSNLQLLDLSRNQLSSLPPEIANLNNLCFLDISENRFQNIPVELYSLDRLKPTEFCVREQGLLLDDALLDTLPAEVANGGTTAILDYLENKATWYINPIIAGAASSIGLVAVVILGWRWKNRRGKQKRKNPT